MSDEEKAQFETVLAADPGLQEELSSQQAARALVYHMQQAAIKAQLKSDPPPQSSKWLWGLLLLLLVGGLSLGLSYYYQSDAYTFDQPMDNFCESLGEKARTRGANMPRAQDDDILSYCDLYATQQYATLKSLLEAKLDKLPLDHALRMKLTYPLAITYAKIGDIEKAKELLISIEKNKYDNQPEAKKTLESLNSFWRQ